MLNLFLFIGFSLCQKPVNETGGFWNNPKIKKMQQTNLFKKVNSFFDSFAPKNSNSNIIARVLNNFHGYFVSYKKSFLDKHKDEYASHKSKNELLRKVWKKADEQKKKGDKIPEQIKNVLSSFNPLNILDGLEL